MAPELNSEGNLQNERDPRDQPLSEPLDGGFPNTRTQRWLEAVGACFGARRFVGAMTLPEAWKAPNIDADHMEWLLSRFKHAPEVQKINKATCSCCLHLPREIMDADGEDKAALIRELLPEIPDFVDREGFEVDTTPVGTKVFHVVTEDHTLTFRSEEAMDAYYGHGWRENKGWVILESPVTPEQWKKLVDMGMRG